MGFSPEWLGHCQRISPPASQGYLPPLAFEFSPECFLAPLKYLRKGVFHVQAPFSEVSEGITPSVSDILNALTYANM